MSEHEDLEKFAKALQDQVLDVADALFALQEGIDDHEACRVCQRLEYPRLPCEVLVVSHKNLL